jgi:hypothetical protein
MPPEQSCQEIDPKYISVLAAERRGKDLKNKQIIPTTLPLSQKQQQQRNTIINQERKSTEA